jgi:hypothetical protein
LWILRGTGRILCGAGDGQHPRKDQDPERSESGMGRVRTLRPLTIAKERGEHEYR